MSQFFKPWRRQAGCVMLVLACVFTAGWVRSQTKFDVIDACGAEFSSQRGFFDVIYYREWNLAKSESGVLVRLEFKGVHYSLVVIPLTVLSAYLLVSKPRSKSVCPTEQKVAPADVPEVVANKKLPL